MTSVLHLVAIFTTSAVISNYKGLVYADTTPYLRQEGIENDRFLSFSSFSRNAENEHDLFWSSGFFEGDMVMSKSQVAYSYGQEVADKAEAAGLLAKSEEMIKSSNDDNQRRLGIIANHDYLWKTRDNSNIVVIPYEFQSSLTTAERTKILNAMDHITTRTGVVKFVERTTEPDWIFYQNTESGCYSFVGRTGGKQTLNLQSMCGFGAALHETCHSLGFFHEQSRADRDDYVTINWENVPAGKENNFNKENTNSLGSPYDFKSVMHYGPGAFGAIYVGCTPTEVKTDIVARIKFQRFDVDNNAAYCINVVDGNQGLNEGQNVNFRPCGENNYVNQNWIIESFDIGSNVIRFALDPTYCLSVNFVNNIKDPAPVVLKKCVEGTFNNQLFPIDQKSWSVALFKWSVDFNYAIARDPTVGAASTYSIFVKQFNFQNIDDQLLKVDFVSQTTGRSATVNSFCEMKVKVTIDTHGHEVGNPDGLSAEDINQLQLMYQCPSGPRHINVFCTADCKCKVNQGKCTSDDQCRTGLRCVYDGVSMNRCLDVPSPTTTPTNNPIKIPTKSPILVPTKNPVKVPTKAPVFLTNSPTTKVPTLKPTVAPTKKPSRSPTSTQSTICSYPNKKQCNKDTKCMWGKDGNKAKCIEFTCVVYIDQIACKTDKRCKWKSSKNICINKA